MNAVIELLNRWGTDFLNFAWPMLWQSSLLIAVVFAFDLLLARRVRAAVRYALWMVVLVKLLLPPALALPTGATWWLWRSNPAPAVPVIKNYTVSYDNAAPDYIPAPSVPYVPLPPTLSGEAWAVMSAGVMGMGLLLWLVFRWSRVAAKVRRAETSHAFADALDEARRLTKLQSCPRLKLVEDTQSPAVYGLFRPVILLPRSLAEKLSARQLRAVLLHEAIHLRRGDVWVNCAQTLLQIAYWWHPLLWLANARIRRVREEAVDDAVMLALHNNGDGADAYAPTLLEVAKFAFRRPLASLGLLGLIGILESRSALRQRVERLIDFRPPRRAGITFLSLCGIFAFSAVALPMGQGPASVTDSFAPDANENPLTTNVVAQASSPKKEVFIQGQFFWMPPDDLKKITADADYHPSEGNNPADWTTDAEQFTNMEKEIKRLRLKPLQMPRIIMLGLTGLQNSYGAELYCGISTNWIKVQCGPYLDDRGITLAYKAESASVSWQGTLAMTNRCEVEGRETMGNNGAVIVSAENPSGAPTNLVVLLRVKTVEEKVHAAGNNPPQFEMRPFKVDPKIFGYNLQRSSNSFSFGLPNVQTNEGFSSMTAPNEQEHKIGVLAKQFFSKLGVNLDPPETMFFNVRLSVLFVYATPHDLDLIERMVRNESPAPVINTTDSDSQPKFRELEHKGHQSYDERHFAEAEQDFIRALSLEPTNPATRYWLFMATKHHQIQTIHLDQFGPYDQAPLRDVVKDLNQKATNAGAIFNIHFYSAENIPAAKNTFVTLKRMNNVSLADAFDAIIQGASQSTIYTTEEAGSVEFSTGPEREFEMRTFKVDTNIFPSNLRKQAGTTNVSAALAQLFKKTGVDMSPPKTIFYNDLLGVIFVYATQEDLKTIERIIQKLNSSPAPKNVSKDLSISTSSDFNKFLNDPLTGNVAADSASAGTTVVSIGPGRQAIYEKLYSIHPDKVSFADLPLNEVIQKLNQLSQLNDLDKAGINFSFNSGAGVPSTAGNAGHGSSDQQIDPATGLPPHIDSATGLPVNPQPADDTQIHVNLALHGASLADLLNAICQFADAPIKYSVTDDGVAFSPALATDANGLEMRTFNVGTVAFPAKLQKQSGGETNTFLALKQVFENAGVDFSPPKAIYYKPRMGILFVYATPGDLKTIEHICQEFCYVPPMIHIKARFMEVPPSFFTSAALHNDFPNGVTNGMVMTNPNLQVLLHELRRQKNIEELAEPEVTTIVSRHTQMRATGWEEVVTNYTAVQNPDGDHPGVLGISPQTGMIEVGPILDVVPLALADGYTLSLFTIASRVEFFGYASPDGLPVTYATNSVTGDRTVMPISLPAFQVSEARAQKNIWDGQTFVLFPDKLPQQSSVYAPDEKRKELITEHIREAEKSYGNKTLVVLVTATLIDPAGNRVHSDDDLPFAQTGIPAQ